MIAAGLLARNAVAKGLTVKPWVKTSLAPGSQVVADYLEAAELQKPLDKLGFNIVGYRLHHLHRQFRPAGAGDFGDDRQARSRRRGGAVGQPQFRGPRQSGRARQLSRLAAAGRRLRARRLDAGRSDPRADRPRQEGRAGLSRRHLAVGAGDPRHHRARRSPPRCSRANTPKCSTATPIGARSRSRPASPTPGTWARPMCRTRPISRA